MCHIFIPRITLKFNGYRLEQQLPPQGCVSVHRRLRFISMPVRAHVIHLVTESVQCAGKSLCYNEHLNSAEACRIFFFFFYNAGFIQSQTLCKQAIWRAPIFNLKYAVAYCGLLAAPLRLMFEPNN